MIINPSRFIQEGTGDNGLPVPTATLILLITYYLTAKDAIAMCIEIITILMHNVIVVIQEDKIEK